MSNIGEKSKEDSFNPPISVFVKCEVKNKEEFLPEESFNFGFYKQESFENLSQNQEISNLPESQAIINISDSQASLKDSQKKRKLLTFIQKKRLKNTIDGKQTSSSSVS